MTLRPLTSEEATPSNVFEVETEEKEEEKGFWGHVGDWFSNVGKVTENFNKGYTYDPQGSLDASYGMAAFGGPVMHINRYKDRDGKSVSSIPSQTQAYKAATVDVVHDTILNATALVLESPRVFSPLNKVLPKDRNIDPKETAIGKLTVGAREKLTTLMGAKQDWEMSLEEKQLLNDPWASISANILAATATGGASAKWKLGSKLGMVPGYDYLPKGAQGIFRWAAFLAAEEHLASFGEGRDKQGSLFDLSPNTPFSIQPEDTYMQAWRKAALGNSFTVGGLGTGLRAGAEIPNILRYTFNKQRIKEINSAKDWLFKNRFQTEDGSSFVKTAEPEVKVDKAVEVDDEAAFQEWLKNPPEEYREIFKEIEKLQGSTDEAFARQRELFDRMKSGLDEMDTLLKEGSQYDELSPIDQKKVDLEVGMMRDKAKPKNVNEAIENLIDKPEADVVVRAIDELDDVSAEKIANSEGKVLDQLELEIENQTKAVDDPLDEARRDITMEGMPESNLYFGGPEDLETEVNKIKRMTDERLTAEIESNKKFELTEKKLKNRQKKLDDFKPKSERYNQIHKDLDLGFGAGQDGNRKLTAAEDLEMERISFEARDIVIESENLGINKAQNEVYKHNFYQELLKEQAKRLEPKLNFGEAAFIPDDLLLGKTTYGMAELEFGSRIDQAAWLLRPGRKRYPPVVKQIIELAQKNGIDINEFRAHGTKVHESIKAQVKDKTGSAKASPDNTAGLTFKVQDQKFGRVVATEKAPDPVVSYVDQWESMSFRDLKKLASPKTNKELFDLIKNRTGKDFRQFTRKDVIAGLQELREKGITVRPTNTRPKLKAQREETKKLIVQKAIDQGEVRPSSTKVSEPDDLPIDLDDPKLDAQSLLAQEYNLAKKFEAEDAAKQAALKEADRDEIGYYDMSLEDKKQHGLLDGWERQTEAEMRIEDLNREIEYINDDLNIAESLNNERLSRGLGFSEEIDQGIETLNLKKQELEIELARLKGDDSVEFKSLKNIKQEVRIMNFDPHMARVMKNREDLSQMLGDLIWRIGGDDTKFKFKDDVKIIKEAPAEWGGKTNFEAGKEAGFYDTLNDHITIYEVTNGLKISEIQERMATAVHEPFHRIQFGYMTLEEMKIFDTIDGQKRIKLFSQLNPNIKTEFSQKATATIEKMTVGFQEYSMLRLSGMDPFEFAVTNKIGTWLDANFPRPDGNSWQLGKFHNTLTTIATVWDRIFEVVRAFGNYAKGRGFKTVDSIYEDAFSGLIAKKRKFNSAVNIIYAEMESARFVDKINKRIDQLEIAQGDPKALKRVNELYQKDVSEFEAFKARTDDLVARANVLERWKSDNEGFLNFVDDAIAKKKKRIDDLKTLALQGGC